MMLLAVDVGNTNTVIGLFENDRLKCDWRIRSTPAITEDEFNIVMSTVSKPVRQPGPHPENHRFLRGAAHDENSG
ncbi:MAG: type III pantothenate kinase [Desulfobacterales bacterium]